MATAGAAASALPDWAGLKDQVWQEVRAAVAASKHSQDFWDELQAFAHAVDWRERWIQGLVAAHVAVLVSVLLARRNMTWLTAVFLALGSVVYFGERINALAGRHWPAFAGQDYFDRRGVFYCVMVSGPAVVNLLIVLVLYLLQVAQLMVSVKRRELVHQARARAAAGGGAAGGKKQR
ncbi:TMEM18 [Scenedesmus sp. PABB004]|nr:TMEM18 [Scenedesmus sp. PABB004]